MRKTRIIDIDNTKNSQRGAEKADDRLRHRWENKNVKKKLIAYIAGTKDGQFDIRKNQ
jgi:hypothetical protein